MADKNRGYWSWKVTDRSANRGLNLLYEPGNWGDILKSAWAIACVKALVLEGASGQFRYLDPFAGAPWYPLVDAARRRFESIPLEWLREAQSPHAARGVIASTAVLVRNTARSHGAEPELCVFDADPTRLQAWNEVSEARLLEVSSGEDALGAALQGTSSPHLVLVDPYDLLDRWKQLLPPAFALAKKSVVLLYLFNKSPRGGGQERNYKTVRRNLESLRQPGTSVLIGRLPSDGILPRAWHEMVLAGPEVIVKKLRGELEGITLKLARFLAETGAFEVIGA